MREREAVEDGRVSFRKKSAANRLAHFLFT